MTDHQEEDDSLLADIFGEVPVTPAEPAGKSQADFAPWHLPRKQWVRKNQWIRCASHLIRRELRNLDRPVRYMCLPGSDLIDVEMFAELCATLNTRLRYLGFNTALSKKPEHLKSILAEIVVKECDCIDDTSRVVQGNILDVSSPRSIVRSAMEEHESFDIINLDICDAFANSPAASVHRAVASILEYQFHSRGKPWLLYITTVADRGAIPVGDVAVYQEIINTNTGKSAEFASLIEKLLTSSENGSEHVGMPDGEHFDHCDDLAFSRLLSVGIGKWLAGLCSQQRWKVEMKSCVYYRRGLTGSDSSKIPEGPELISLVFGFTKLPTSVADPSSFKVGSANNTIVPSRDFELESGLQILGKACKPMCDLDCLMQTNPGLVETLTREFLPMLVVRNYDTLAYKSWINALPLLQFCETPS